MKRRIVSIILALALILTVCGVGCVGVSAEDNVATITVGNKTYTAKVGDFIEYSISFRSTGDNITTAQVELPVDFSAFSGYSESEIDTHLARIAPTTAENSVVKRFDKSNTFGLTGYVLNFVNVNGYSFRTEKEIMKLIFCVEKAGSYNLTAKVRNVNDIGENVVIDGNYTLQDPRFSYVENLTDTPINVVVDGTVTAVHDLNVDALRALTDPNVYTITGQNMGSKVDVKQLPAGIYIIKGRKVQVK